MSLIFNLLGHRGNINIKKYKNFHIRFKARVIDLKLNLKLSKNEIKRLTEENAKEKAQNCELLQTNKAQLEEIGELKGRYLNLYYSLHTAVGSREVLLFHSISYSTNQVRNESAPCVLV